MNDVLKSPSLMKMRRKLKNLFAGVCDIQREQIFQFPEAYSQDRRLKSEAHELFGLDIEIPDLQRVILDKLPAPLDLISH